MELPSVRYVHTSEGVSLAYTVLGDGPPLFYSFAGPGLSFFEFEWRLPQLVEQYAALASERTLVRFDWRNTGLSTRGVMDVSTDAHLRDLLALQDHLGFERVALRIHGGARTAISYAAMHPTRVSALVLSSPSVLTAAPGQPASVSQQLLAIGAGNDWRLFARLYAVSVAGWEGPEASWFASYVEAGADGRDFFRTFAATSSDDITTLVPAVQCPTLIMQRREPPNYFFDTVDAERHLADSRSLTKDLPAARLTLLDGSSMMISVDPDATAAVLAFLRECDGRLENAGSGSVRTMVFIDLADHTRMMQRLGDQRGRDVLRDFERLTRSALASHGGVEIKSMGDGFLASFASAQRALECALTVERACSAYESETLSVRIGVNAGEPIVEESDLFGASVITAARVASRAAGGQVVVSDVVRLLVAGKGFSFRDLGEQSLKGLDEPVRIWELALDEVSGSG